MRRTFVIALVLTVCLPSIAMARALLCDSDGEASMHCCGPAPTEEPAPTAQVRRGSCCEVTPGEAPRTTLAEPGAVLEAFVPPIAFLVTVAAPAPPRSVPVRATEAKAHAPPGSSSLFASRCALLL